MILLKNNFLKIFILIYIIIFTGFKMDNKEKSPAGYEVYVNEMIRSFGKEMEHEFDLICSGGGGQMPRDVEMIEVSFVAYRKGSIEEARKLEVQGTQKLLKHINNHEKIRPYLREYPFKHNRASVSISFRNPESGHHYTDGSVVYVSFARNIIFYSGSEIKMEKPGRFVNMTKHKLEFEHDDKTERPVERLYTILEEPYEEALEKLARTK